MISLPLTQEYTGRPFILISRKVQNLNIQDQSTHLSSAQMSQYVPAVCPCPQGGGGGGGPLSKISASLRTSNIRVDLAIAAHSNCNRRNTYPGHL